MVMKKRSKIHQRKIIFLACLFLWLETHTCYTFCPAVYCYLLLRQISNTMKHHILNQLVIVIWSLSHV